MNEQVVVTDQEDYAPSSTAYITASGFTPGLSVEFTVVNYGADNVEGTEDDVAYSAWYVIDGSGNDAEAADGVLGTNWFVPWDAADRTLGLTAVEDTNENGIYGDTGDLVAKDSFTDAAPTGNVAKNYQHWADGDAPLIPGEAEWNGDILSDGKSDYFEGEVIPHVYIVQSSNSTPLVNGEIYSFDIIYNYYNASGNASGFDYITTYDISRDPGLVSNASGLTPVMDSSFTGAGNQGAFYTVGANIISATGPTYSSETGTRDGIVTVTFEYTGPTSGGDNGSQIAEIYYGLHIAAPGGSGMGTNGASAYPGGSLQTTIDNTVFSGALSVQLAPGAIEQGLISGIKYNDLNGDGDRDTGEAALAGWTMYLDTDNDGVLDAGETSVLTSNGSQDVNNDGIIDPLGTYIFNVTPDSNKADPDNDPFIVREVQQNGWTQTAPGAGFYSVTITADTPQYLNQDFGNQLQTPALTIVKSLTNADDAQVDTAGEVIEYTIVVDNTGNVDLTGVVLTDTFADGATLLSGDTDSDSILDVNETWTYSADYTVTQADLNAGNPLVNVAVVDTAQTEPQQDDATSSVLQTPALTIVKSLTNADDAQVDTAGEVIEYTIVVDNTGNVDLTGVVLTDTFADGATLLSGDTDSDSILDVNETWTYSADYTVTQADLNAGNPLVNVAVVDTAQTEPQQDDATSSVLQTPALTIVKSLTNADDAQVDTAGEVIEYTIVVDNTGNVDLTGVVLTDTFADGATLLSGDTDSDSILDVNETWTYSADYTVTQADLNAGNPLVNVAVVDTAQTEPQQDDATSSVLQTPTLSIDKVTVYGTQTGDGLTGVMAGSAIGWQYTVDNTGNVDLSNISVTDSVNGITPTYQSGDQNADGILQTNETWSYTASGTAVSGPYSNIGTASGSIGTTTVTDSDPSSYVGISNTGLIAPTGTTPNDYVNGTFDTFSEYYASQGGVIQYSVNTTGKASSLGKIGNTNPGVFFYYTGLSNSIQGSDGSDAGTAPDPLSIKIDQSDASLLFPAFSTTKNDVKLFQVIDLDSNGIDAGDTVTQVQLASNQITLGTGANAGDVTINFTPDAVGSLYVASVKYATASVVGTSVGTDPAGWSTVNYTFNTDVGNDGVIEETSVGGITIAPKFAALTLDGAVGDGAKVLSEAQLGHVIKQAIAYWAENGANGAELAAMRQADVTITDLGEAMLAGTDSQGIWIDDDAAGHGWSLGRGGVAQGKVDLLSAVAHEFGHLLGYDHGELDADLAVGERDLPLVDDRVVAFANVLGQFEELDTVGAPHLMAA